MIKSEESKSSLGQPDIQLTTNTAIDRLACQSLVTPTRAEGQKQFHELKSDYSSVEDSHLAFD